jgi:hypothetical protein
MDYTHTIPVGAAEKNTAEKGRVVRRVLAGAFFLGGLLGLFLARSVAGEGFAALSEYINGFMDALGGGRVAAPTMPQALWSVLRWPLLTVLLSCTAAGLVGIPGLFALRGFLFSFCVAAFVRVLGKGGVVAALLLLGVESTLSIPVLFVLGAQGMYFSAVRRERKGRRGEMRRAPPSGAAFLHPANVVCLAVLLFCAVWETLFVPMLLTGLQTMGG